MVTPKVTKPAPQVVAPRHRAHSLAPEHLGERGAAAALIVAIGGMAIFIAAVAMTVGGLTLPNSYAGSLQPPNLSQLAMSQVVGGIALLVLGLVIVATAAALLADLPLSRPLAAGSSAIAALLAAAGFVLVVSAARRDLILLAALGVAIVAFGGATVILARLRR
ncbi:MAG: hypothetical protein M3P32_08770 [Chloroflexota bacterium]|nr:hypothetical protein [Chloroflexota bacterium]